MYVTTDLYSLSLVQRTDENAGNSLTFGAGDAFGIDQLGGNVYINGGRSTGTGYGEIFFQLPIPSGTGDVPNDIQTIAHLGYDGLAMHQHYIFFYPSIGDPTIMVDTQGDQDVDGTALTVKGGNAGNGGTGDHRGGDLVLRGGDSVGTDQYAGEVHVHTGQATGNADGGGFKIFMPLQHGAPSGTDPVPEENFVWFSGDHGLTFYGGGSYIMNGSAELDGSGSRLAIAAGAGNGIDMAGGFLDLESGAGTGIGDVGEVRINCDDGIGVTGDVVHARETIGVFNGVGGLLRIQKQSDTKQPKFILYRTRAGDADLEADDRMGGLRWIGKVGGDAYEFARIQTYYDGTGGVMEFYAASDAVGTLGASAIAIDGANGIINQDFDTYFAGLLNIKASPDADANAGITTRIPNNSLTFSKGDVVYVDGSGYAALADATDNTTNPAIGLVLWDITGTDAMVPIMLHGIMDLTTIAPTWNPGGMIYLAVGGGMTQTPPAATGNMIQILGIALAADKLYCKPELVMVEAL